MFSLLHQVEPNSTSNDYKNTLAWNNGFWHVDTNQIDNWCWLWLKKEFRQFDYPWLLSFHHSSKEFNTCADRLIKYQAGLESDSISWRRCRALLSTILIADFIRLSYSKFCLSFSFLVFVFSFPLHKKNADNITWFEIILV